MSIFYSDLIKNVKAKGSAVTQLTEGSNINLSNSSGAVTISVTEGVPTSATAVSIADAGSHFTATTTEGALQELGETLDGLNTALENI